MTPRGFLICGESVRNLSANHNTQRQGQLDMSKPAKDPRAIKINNKALVICAGKRKSVSNTFKSQFKPRVGWLAGATSSTIITTFINQPDSKGIITVSKLATATREAAAPAATHLARPIVLVAAQSVGRCQLK